MRALMYIIGEFTIGIICFAAIIGISKMILWGIYELFEKFSISTLFIIPLLIFILISVVYRLYHYIISHI